MKKKIKKILTQFVPKGILKEKIKLFYYSIFTSSKYKFDIEEKDNSVIYKTKCNAITLLTNEALYHVAADFDYYLHFYKLKKGDTVIDAGANFGHLSIYFSQLVGDTGKVFAFEPDAKNIAWLKNNINLNKDNVHQNINIQELLLWNKNEWIDFNEEGSVGSSAVWIPENAKTVKKEAVTIDDWMVKMNIQKIDFIKMDIEGAEIEAIEGCVKCIEQCKPNFAIASYHVVNGEQTYIKLETFFKSINYPFKTVHFRGTEIITFAGPALINE